MVTANKSTISTSLPPYFSPSQITNFIGSLLFKPSRMPSQFLIIPRLAKPTMASPFSKVFLFCFLVIHFYIAICAEYEVNGDDGWIAPKHDNQIYNKWASKNRFQVDDTIHFKYKKDSVLVVTEEEYEKCQPSSHPIFFSNNGDTVFKLDRPGLFYFISGVTGHCQKGQKMIIKVLEPAAPPQSQNQNSTSTDTPDNVKNGAVELAAVTSSTLLLLLISIWLSF